MDAASAYRPERSSSKPGPIAWARASAGSAATSASASLMLRVIQATEVLEDHAPLFGRQSCQLVPRGIADFRAGAGGAGEERRRCMHAVARGGVTDAVLLLVGLVPREAAAGIEQLAIQPFLPL